MEREVKGLTMTVKFNEDDVMGMVQKLKEQGKLKAVVHAHWIYPAGYFHPAHCSNCGKCSYLVINAPSDYCPNCGAKMDEGEINANKLIFEKATGKDENNG